MLTPILTNQALQTDVSADSVPSRPCMESSQISTWLLFNDARRLTGSLLQIASQITQWLPDFFTGTKYTCETRLNIQILSLLQETSKLPF